MGRTQEIGSAGEGIAAEWLREEGFLIADVNWRSGRYEIDIVAERLGVLHFVEVKTRKDMALTTPEDAMTRAKVRALLHAANHYVALHHVAAECQIDLIAIDMLPDGNHRLRYIPDAANLHW